MGDLSHCWCAFSCTICNQTATSLAVSRVAVPKVMTTHTDHRKTSSAERNSGRKLELTERNRRILKRIVSKHDRTAAANVTAELYTHLEDRFHENSPARASHTQHPR